MSEDDLVQAIADATRSAVAALYERNPGHHFYYVSLITSGEAHSPTLTAWSHEALAAAVASRPDDVNAAMELKWSYADSPFFGWGEEFFYVVRSLVDARCTEMVRDFAAEFELRLRLLEKAVRKLDEEGLFSRRAERAAIVVNVEVMPPDAGNVQRARRLNPPAALVDWLAEAAELDQQ